MPASISGRAFLDYNNNGRFGGPDTGLANVTVTLSGGSQESPQTTQTDAAGRFKFTGLAAGEYTLTETQPTSTDLQDGKTRAGSAGGVADTANIVSAIKVRGGTVATGYRFGEVPIVGTGGTVFEDLNRNGKKDDGEPGVPGVTVTLAGTSVVSGVVTPLVVQTDSQGNYAFTGLTPGMYSITETQPAGFSDGREQNGTPRAEVVRNDRFAGIRLAATRAESGGFHFGEVRGGTLAGTVFADADGDAQQAASGEPGVGRARVRLTGVTEGGRKITRALRTAADGSFVFGHLKAGTYALHQRPPVGYPDGTATEGTIGGNAGEPNRITGIKFPADGMGSGYAFALAATPDLKLSQKPRVTVLAPGQRVTITYTLTNRGTAAIANAEVKVLFGGLRFLSASDATAFDRDTRTWTVGELAAGQSVTLQLTFRAGKGGTFLPTSTATTADGELSTRNNRGASVMTVGTRQTSPAPGSAPGGLPPWVQRYQQFSPLTRLWLYKELLG